MDANPTTPTLYTWAGGGVAFTRLIDAFYDRVEHDASISPLFPGGVSREHREHVAAWWSEVFGGPARYSAELGGYTNMVDKHRELDISPDQRRRFVELMSMAADDAGLPDDPEFRSALLAYLEWGTRLAFANSKPRAEVIAEAPVPRSGLGRGTTIRGIAPRSNVRELFGARRAASTASTATAEIAPGPRRLSHPWHPGPMHEHTFVDRHGVEIFYRSWPRPDPRAVVVIAHGASEHSGRYGRFASALNDAGYAAYALDHRGHGRTSGVTGPGRMGPPGGDALTDDLQELVEIAGKEHPEVAAIVFGHSMGSMIALAHATRHPAAIAGTVLSGFAAPLDDPAALAGAVQGAVDAGMGDEPIDALGAFNEAFEPARTRFDWLSRDPEEVDKYVADPYCGDDMPLTYGFVAHMFGLVATAVEPDVLANIAAPMLLVTGEQDPAAAMGASPRALEARLRSAGVDVAAEYYPDARHELLNELNRDEVTADIIDWIDRTTSR